MVEKMRLKAEAPPNRRKPSQRVELRHKGMLLLDAPIFIPEITHLTIVALK